MGTKKRLVREYAEQFKEFTPGQKILASLPEGIKLSTAWTYLGDLYREGILDRRGRKGSYEYRLARGPKDASLFEYEKPDTEVTHSIRLETPLSNEDFEAYEVEVHERFNRITARLDAMSRDVGRLKSKVYTKKKKKKVRKRIFPKDPIYLSVLVNGILIYWVAVLIYSLATS